MIRQIKNGQQTTHCSLKTKRSLALSLLIPLLLLQCCGAARCCFLSWADPLWRSWSQLTRGHLQFWPWQRGRGFESQQRCGALLPTEGEAGGASPVGSRGRRRHCAADRRWDTQTHLYLHLSSGEEDGFLKSEIWLSFAFKTKQNWKHSNANVLMLRRHVVYHVHHLSLVC